MTDFEDAGMLGTGTNTALLKNHSEASWQEILASLATGLFHLLGGLFTAQGSSMNDVVRRWQDIPGDTEEKYQLYLGSAEWYAKRELVMARAKGLCEFGCGKPVKVVHHQTYIRKYAEEVDDLLGLCRECHEQHHGIKSAPTAIQKIEEPTEFPPQGPLVYPWYYGSEQRPSRMSRDHSARLDLCHSVGEPYPHCLPVPGGLRIFLLDEYVNRLDIPDPDAWTYPFPVWLMNMSGPKGLLLGRHECTNINFRYPDIPAELHFPGVKEAVENSDLVVIGHGFETQSFSQYMAYVVWKANSMRIPVYFPIYGTPVTFFGRWADHIFPIYERERLPGYSDCPLGVLTMAISLYERGWRRSRSDME